MSRKGQFLAIVLVFVLAAGLLWVPPAQALERTTRLQIFRSVVQLGPVIEQTRNGSKERLAFGWGSGTIISRDGLILTNYHVTDTSDLETQLEEGERLLDNTLAVYLTLRSDRPPVLSYFASVVAQSKTRDLALLRITSDLAGQAVDTAQLNLSALQMGDSDLLEPGDPLYIFGYPGIGGETITFTAGFVSGFTFERDIGYRAWIKTDATITGGNSGGTAVNDDGLLVGVPTEFGRGGVGALADYVDARPLADTNGDGVLDEKDLAVPMGGFINALRPLAVAIPMLAEGGAADLIGQANHLPGVVISGAITDAATGKALFGATLYALKPGTSARSWEDAGYPDDQIYASARADRRGRFTLPTPLERGDSYSLVAICSGYFPVVQESLPVEENSAAEVDMTIRMDHY